MLGNRIRRGGLNVLAAVTGLVGLFGTAAPAAATVDLIDLELRPNTYNAAVGDQVRIELYGTSAVSGDVELIFSARVVLAWDPSQLEGIVLDTTGDPFPDGLSEFPAGSTLNDTFTDGDAVWTGRDMLGGPGIPISPAGTLLATFEFIALAPISDTRLTIEASRDGTITIVIASMPAGKPVTGELLPDGGVMVEIFDDNDDCVDAIDVGEGVTQFDTAGATTDGPMDCDTEADVWYAFSSPCTVDATVSLCGSSYDTHLSVYEDGCPPTVLLACNDDAGVMSDCAGSPQSEVTFSATGNQRYLIRIGGAGGATGLGQMTITTVATTSLVNLELRPSVQSVDIGDTVELELYAVACGSDAEVFSLQAILQWDPTKLEGVTLDRTGEPAGLDVSDFLSDPLNDSFADGDAIYTGHAAFGDSFTVTTAGTLITTFSFTALEETPGTPVDIPLMLDDGETRVINAMPAGQNITGELTGATVIIECIDMAPPVLEVPMDVTIECDESTDPSNTGEATATDDCDDDPTVTFSDSVAAGACAQESVITRTWKATDTSGNMTTGDQIITIQDTTDPVVTAPADIDVKADAGGCTVTLSMGTIGTATAIDNCSDTADLVASFVRSDGAMTIDAPFDAADSPITIEWFFEDECGNVGSAVQTVTVDAVNELVLDLVLDGGVHTPLSRCITFELFECGGGMTTHSEEITFTGGSFSGTIDIPCGIYTCVTARDKLHTLRRTLEAADGFGISGTQYEADFASASKDLLGGNLNDDAFIDILDFGIFSGQWMDMPGASTCATAMPHSDISGDGTVFSEDFAFIQGNFQAAREDNCCGLAELRDGGGPTTRISVRELRRRGLGHLAVADLTRDGWLDEDDMVAFIMGERPERTNLNPGGAVPDELKKRDGNVRWERGRDVRLLENVEIDNRNVAARDVTIDGTGRLVLVDATLGARRLSLSAGAGLVLDGGVLSVQSLDVDPAATFAWAGGIIEILGGTFTSASPELRLGNAGASNALWLNAGAEMRVEDALIGLQPWDDGELVIRDSTFTADRLLLVGGAGMGRLHVADGGVVLAGQRVVVGERGVVTGDGLIVGDLESRGLVAPTGALTVAGAYTQDRFDGVLSLGDFDRLVVNGPAYLGGVLEVCFEFDAPRAGDRVTLIDADAVKGRFDQVEVTGLGSLRFEVRYVQDGVVLVVTSH